MNKFILKVIRVWIALSSIFIFGIGWVTLSHSEKPAALTPFSTSSFVSGVEFTNIPSLEELTTNNRSSTAAPGITFTRPATRLRTSGS